MGDLYSSDEESAAQDNLTYLATGSSVANTPLPVASPMDNSSALSGLNATLSNLLSFSLAKDKLAAQTQLNSMSRTLYYPSGALAGVYGSGGTSTVTAAGLGGVSGLLLIGLLIWAVSRAL